MADVIKAEFGQKSKEDIAFQAKMKLFTDVIHRNASPDDLPAGSPESIAYNWLQIFWQYYPHIAVEATRDILPVGGTEYPLDVEVYSFSFLKPLEHVDKANPVVIDITISQQTMPEWTSGFKQKSPPSFITPVQYLAREGHPGVVQFRLLLESFLHNAERTENFSHYIAAPNKFDPNNLAYYFAMTATQADRFVHLRLCIPRAICEMEIKPAWSN